MISILANMDIQGCTSMCGVTSYLAEYIAHCGAESGSPHVAAEKELANCPTRAAEEGKGATVGINRRLSAQVSPGVLTQL